MRKRLILNEKTGAFEESHQKAKSLIAEHLRGLPGSFTTRDTSDPDKIHELDPPHIVDALTLEQGRAEQRREKLPSIYAGVDLWGGPFDQFHIDLIKFKVIRNLITTATRFSERGMSFPLRKLHHLWFPKASLDPRQLRTGRPPLRVDLPIYLKDKDLLVDVFNWPERIKDMLRERNEEVPDMEAFETTCPKSPAYVGYSL